MATSETKLEIYLAEVTLNVGQPAQKMIVIENEDSYICIDKRLFNISLMKPLEDGVRINKLDNICYLFFKL